MTSHSSYQEAVTRFSEYLKSHRKRCTPERFRILKCIYGIKDHFDAHTLYAELEKDAYHVSLATIYNTLEVLCECGLLRKHRFESVNSEYELARSSHIHLICNDCGKVREVSGEAIEGFLGHNAFAAFTPAYHTTYVYGTCSTCARRLKREAAKRLRESTHPAPRRHTEKNKIQ